MAIIIGDKVKENAKKELFNANRDDLRKYISEPFTDDELYRDHLLDNAGPGGVAYARNAKGIKGLPKNWGDFSYEGKLHYLGEYDDEAESERVRANERGRFIRSSLKERLGEKADALSDDDISELERIFDNIQRIESRNR